MGIEISRQKTILNTKYKTYNNQYLIFNIDYLY